MKRFRIGYLGRLFGIYLLITMTTRLYLYTVAGQGALVGTGALPQVFGAGLVNDLLPFFCLTLPLAALVLLPGTRRLRTGTRRTLAVLFGLFAALFLFTAVAEVAFWDEFMCRFNFIAVDYLVYTTEVISNIMESYPVVVLLAGIAVTAALLAFLTLRPRMDTFGTESCLQQHVAGLAYGWAWFC